MIFGANDDAVEEVFELAKSRAILVRTTVLPTVQRETSLERAKHLAWQEVFGREGFTWTDIRELEVAAVMKFSYEMTGVDVIRDALAKKNNALLLLLRRHLTGPYGDLIDDVYADLGNCALKRGLLGRVAGFLEDLFNVYRSGGWPCGWDGEYPDGGRMIAYYPDIRQEST